MPIIAQAIDEELTLNSSGWILERGGLVLVFLAVALILYGLFEGSNDPGANRQVGYGSAMAAAGGIALFLSSQVNENPALDSVTGSPWLYGVAAVVGCLLYVARIVDNSKHRSRRRRGGLAVEQDRQPVQTRRAGVRAARRV